MEKTFQDLYSELQAETGDTSSSKLVLFKQWLNKGLTILQSRLGIQYTEEERTANAVLNQSRYQKPEDAFRIVDIRFYDGSIKVPLKQVPDNETWQRLQTTITSGYPEYYHLIGQDLYEVFPAPAGNYSGGLILTCKIRQKPMSAADYSTGTVAATAGSQNIVGTGTTFIADMIGRKLRFADGVGDGVWYRISGVTDATHLTIENFYNGATTSGAYLIGEIANVPPEVHQTIYDYAMWRYHLGKENIQAAREYKNIWESDLELYSELYDAETDQQVFNEEPRVDLETTLMQVPRIVT